VDDADGVMSPRWMDQRIAQEEEKHPMKTESHPLLKPETVAPDSKHEIVRRPSVDDVDGIISPSWLNQRLAQEEAQNSQAVVGGPETAFNQPRVLRVKEETTRVASVIQAATMVVHPP